MEKFTFTRGVWTDGHPNELKHDEEDWHDYLATAGFSIVPHRFGAAGADQLEIYENVPEAVFLATVFNTTVGGWKSVFIPDFPSYMMFLRDFATPISLSAIEHTQVATAQAVEKLFQAHHGHASFHVCVKCDPVGWAREQAAIKAYGTRVSK